MKISKNFCLNEFLTTRSNIKIIPSRQEIRNINLFVNETLQPLRDLIKKPFIITSGLRSLELNNFLGGVKNSRHLTGMACDFKIEESRLLLDAYKMLKSSINFGKLIIYLDEKRYHIEYGTKKCVYLKWSNNKTYYPFEKYLGEL